MTQITDDSIRIRPRILLALLMPWTIASNHYTSSDNDADNDIDNDDDNDHNSFCPLPLLAVIDSY